MSGLSLTSFYAVKNVLARTIQLSQDVWPETSGAIRIVRANYAFRVAFAALQARPSQAERR